ncbi:MAG: glycosyltransferase family 2 protein [Aeriscardovia sp.]|nr:glycosyltransferase family 2 protein [Aeriscardovia sp.]
MQNNLGVSIIVCCYNSAWIIERCLSAIISQRVSQGLCWELILVNNASSDNTKELAKRILKNSGINYLIKDENMPGLLNARKCGVTMARYSIMIFCDDDNILCSTYVQTAYDIMRARPELGALGGKGEAEFQTTPDPFILAYLSSYAVGSQANHSKDCVWGAGLCLRSEIVRKIYAKQEMYLTGRKGDVLLAGDDGELVLSVRLNGFECDSDDRLEYVHVLASKRLTKNYINKMFQGFALASPIITIYNSILKRRSFLYIFLSYLILWVRFVKNISFNSSKETLFIRTYVYNIIKAYHSWSFKGLYIIYKKLKVIYPFPQK